MNYRKNLSIVTVYILLISNISLADLCLKLKDISGGEFHTIALMEDNTLWSCGDNGFWQLGQGSNAPDTSILKQVKGENGIGYLQNIATFDAGWKHSLATDADGTIWAWGGCGSNKDIIFEKSDKNGRFFLTYIQNMV